MKSTGADRERRTQAGRARAEWTVAVALAAAAGACGPGPLAEAGGHELSVDEAAELLVEHSTLPVDTQVVRAVAELWVDYTLLAGHLLADTGLATLDVELIVEGPRDQIALSRLWEAVIDADTVVSDEELAERFAADLPGARATTSQILFLFPRPATDRQRDSVLAVARGVRDNVAGGADFAEMAARYSGDPGSRPRGGRMGSFERGEMLAPLDSAAFRMQPGELSGPVETDLGYHVLRLDAVTVPELAEVGAEFRVRIQQERLNAAEAAWVEAINAAAGLRLADDALAIARAVIGASPTRFSRGAAAQPLVLWDGGSYTAGDLLEVARTSPEGFAESVLATSDAELREVLLRRGSEELLLAEAAARGLEATTAESDSLAAATRAAIRERAVGIGLLGSDEGADIAGLAPADIVNPALIRVVSGQQELLPLQGAALALRETGSWRVHLSRIEATVERARVVREGGAP